MQAALPWTQAPAPALRWWRLGLMLFLGWTAYGLLYAYQAVEMYAEMGRPVSWAHQLATNLVGMWGWVPLAQGLFWLSARFTIRRGNALRAVSVLMLAAIAVVFARAMFIHALDPWIHWYDAPPSFWGDVMPTSLQNNLLLSWIMIGLAHAMLYFERAHAQERFAAELQAQLAQARLQAISAQLNPHFLFNALNSIAELVHHDAARADRMLVGLSALLRCSLDTSRLPWVTLREELDLLAQYLEIEKVRLGDRLRVDWHVAGDCLDEAVPPLLLQPLVENAVVHAIARRTQPGRMRIGARMDGGSLVLDIEDDGADGMADVAGHGIGLANTRARLGVLYGDAASLSITPIEGGGTRVSLDLPGRQAPSASVDEPVRVRGFHANAVLAR